MALFMTFHNKQSKRQPEFLRPVIKFLERMTGQCFNMSNKPVRCNESTKLKKRKRKKNVD